MPEPNESELNLFERLSKDLKESALKAKESIESLAKSVSAERLFIAVTAYMSIAPADLISEATHGTVSAKSELLAFHLFPFFGASHAKDISPFQIDECVRALEDLFRAESILGAYPDSAAPETPAQSLARDVHRQARIVRGSAYQEQTAEEIKAVQGRFDGWFEARVGVSPTRAQEILWAISDARQAATSSFMQEAVAHGHAVRAEWLRAKREAPKRRDEFQHKLLSTFKDDKHAWLFGRVQRQSELAPDHLPISSASLTSLTPPPTEKEWQGLISLIGLTKDVREVMTDPVEVRQKPLFMMLDGSVIVIDVSNAMDALWDAFERVTKSDGKFFERYQAHKGAWLEEKVVEYLAKVFPKANIYHDLSYPDLAKPGKATTELDIAVSWGPFLILVEAKAKQFRLESQLGDVGRLCTDIKKNVVDAFEQARRANKYIQDVAKPEFTEISTGRKLAINKKNIQKTYLLTVSLHQLANLATRLAVFQDLGLFRDGEYPLSISLADLELVTEFCEGADVFLHYVETRLDVQKAQPNILVDEADFLGAYLDTRFRDERLWGGRKKEEFNAIWLSGWSEAFDAWMMHRRGDLPEAPEIKLNVPEEIREILTELRARTDDAARWIAFSLLGMSDKSLSVIARAFREVHTAALTPGMFRRLVNQVDDTVISIVASLDQPPDLLRVRTEMITTLEKYRRKAPKSIGFGIMVMDRTRPFECATWAEHPWKHDKELENLLEEEPLMMPAPGNKLPGRNEICFCGSGKKYKKCCLVKVEAARRIN
jgi:hypothetical protein